MESEQPDELTDARKFAERAHAGQKYGPDQNYIEHPVRLAEKFEEPTLKIVALLHDVVEDSDITIMEILWRFGSVVANAVLALTRGKEPYSDYIEAVAKNRIASQVKVEDLLDNIDHIDRYPDWGFVSLRPRYEEALKVLER